MTNILSVIVGGLRGGLLHVDRVYLGFMMVSKVTMRQGGR